MMSSLKLASTLNDMRLESWQVGDQRPNTDARAGPPKELGSRGALGLGNVAWAWPRHRLMR